MLSICSTADMTRALASPIDAELRCLLALRCKQLTEQNKYDVAEVAHFVVVQPGDTLEAIEAEANAPIATNFVDGTRYGDANFAPSFEWVENHGRWREAVTILSDDGFAVALFVPDEPGVDPTLLALLREHA